MKTFIFAALLAATAVSASQPAAAIQILPPGLTSGCGMMNGICKQPPPPPRICQCLGIRPPSSK